MDRNSWRCALAIILTACGIPLAAQSPAGAGSGDADRNPMSCWWQTDKRAVRVAEPFALTLTCRVMETERAAVVPNVSDIEPTSIQLTPFEVLEGTRHEDVVVPPWRYLQFVYTVRLLGDEFFGRDVALPRTNVTFRVQTRGADALEGAEHQYVLPAMPMRILSLLPAQAADIRDPAVETFGDVEARRFRSTVTFVAGTICFAFAAVFLIMAGVRLVDRFRTRGPVAEATVPARTLLAGCLHEIERVRSEAAREGWTPALAGRALVPFRVVAAIALLQPVTQKFVSRDTPAREGQLTLGHGFVRRRRALVSAATTADTIDRLRATANSHRAMAGRSLLEQIREALAGLTAVRYASNGSVDAVVLDRVLDSGSSAVRRLRVARMWPVRAAEAIRTSAANLGAATWRH